MPQNLLDVHRGNAGGHHVSGCRMTKTVRSGPHVEPGLFPVVRHQQLHAAHREQTVVAVLKQGRGRCGGQAPSGVEGEQLADAGLGFVVQWHHAAA